MSAPDVVVRAVQEALDCETHGYGWLRKADCCPTAERIADAAHKASLEWAAEQMNGRYAQPWAVDVLRRWADESEASRG